MQALIIANGPAPRRDIVRTLLASADLIVCADGGANRARALGIRPHIIIGDLDSISRATRRHYSRVPVLHVKDQYSTDLEKTIMFCIQRGVEVAHIIGALGERIDHATGSLGCFRKFGRRIELQFHDAHGILSDVGRRLTVRTSRGRKLSLLPLGRCTGVTTRNLKYPLRDDVLELGVREGIGNESLGARVSISVKRGTLLLYQFT